MVSTITTGELEHKIENKEDFVLVDVLGEDHFNEEHLPNAINIPLNQIGERALQELDEDDDIVVYCASTECQASPKAAEKLEKLGFQNVTDYEPGVKGWKEAGNEVEG